MILLTCAVFIITIAIVLYKNNLGPEADFLEKFQVPLLNTSKKKSPIETHIASVQGNTTGKVPKQIIKHVSVCIHTYMYIYV